MKRQTKGAQDRVRKLRRELLSARWENRYSVVKEQHGGPKDEQPKDRPARGNMLPHYKGPQARFDKRELRQDKGLTKSEILDGFSVSVPRTAVAEAEGFIGPTIGRSGYRTMAEFDAAVGAKYQQLIDQGYAQTMRRVGQGLVANDPLAIGSEVDTFARTGMRRWLANAEGIQEGPGRIIQINRRLYDPMGTGAYRVPDVYIPGARTIYDGTIAEKTNSLSQTLGFRTFSGGGNVTIVRPSTLVTPGAQGSYGLYFP